MCSIRFLGPPDKLAMYQNSLQTNAHRWRTPSPSASAKNTATDVGHTGMPAPLAHAHTVHSVPHPISGTDPSYSVADTSTQSKASGGCGSGNGSIVRENIQDMLGLILPAPCAPATKASSDHLPCKRPRTDSAQASSTATSAAASGQKRGSGGGVGGEPVEYVTECGICYSFNGSEHETDPDPEMHMPDQVCPNAQCGKMFHKNCLVEWLRAVPSSRRSFGTIFGSCPYCCARLSVSSVL